MNLRNKKLLITLRTLFGAFMLFSGVSGFLALSSGSMEGMPPEMIESTKFLVSTGIFYMIKITEIIAGALLLTNTFPAIAVIFLAPIAVGIIVVNANIAPAYVISGVVVCLFEMYFGYAYWDNYKSLFARH